MNRLYIWMFAAIVMAVTGVVTVGVGEVLAQDECLAVGKVGYPTISSDGRYVVLYSGYQTGLVPVDENGQGDIFLRDRLTGENVLVSMAFDGEQANGTSYPAVISADGSTIVFQSKATNLVENDTNGVDDVFAYDIASGEIELISIGSGNSTQSNGWSVSPDVSADGRYVVYESNATNLIPNDNNNSPDVFLRDRRENTTSRVSVKSDGMEVVHSQGLNPRISGDANFIVYHSISSQLVANDTNHRQDAFIYERSSGNTERMSVATDGTQANQDSSTPNISHSGRYVVFMSKSSSLVDNDRNNLTDVFLRDRDLDTTSRISVSSTGEELNATSLLESLGHSIGSGKVAFHSNASNLVPSDTNETTDVFVHTIQTQETELVSQDSSGAQGAGASQWQSISASGRYVVFSAQSQLSPDDQNNYEDVYLRDLQTGITELVSVPSGCGTQPSPIDSLVLSVAGPTSVRLTWMAPSDDGPTKKASEYLVRRAGIPIETILGWEMAETVSGVPEPAESGTPQEMLVTGLSRGATYYFSIRSKDDVGAISALSNSPGLTLPALPTGADAGFRSDPNGFLFQNRRIYPAEAVFEQLFGSEAVKRNDTWCASARNFYENTFHTWSQGYSCLGFSAASLINFYRFPQSAAGPMAMPQRDNLAAYEFSSEFENSIAFYKGVQLSQSYVDFYGEWRNAICPRTDDEPLARIIDGIRTNQTPILNLKYDGTRYHAVVPYLVEFVTENQALVYVYDNEAPKQERVVTFTRKPAGWEWQYTFTGSVASYGSRIGGCGDMFAVPLDEFLKRATPLENWCGSETQSASLKEATELLIALPPDGRWTITNGDAQTADLNEGQLTSSIPGAYQLPESFGSTGVEGQPHLVILPAGGYQIGATELENAQGFSLYDDGRTIGVFLQPASKTTPLLEIGTDLQTAFIGPAAIGKEISVQFITELPAASRTAKVTVTGGIPTSLDVGFNGSKLTLVNSSGVTTYTIALANQGSNVSSFASRVIVILANEKHSLSPDDWTSLDSGMSLEIDRGNNGTVDETVPLQPGGDSKIYLPIIQH